MRSEGLFSISYKVTRARLLLWRFLSMNDRYCPPIRTGLYCSETLEMDRKSTDGTQTKEIRLKKKESLMNR